MFVCLRVSLSERETIFFFFFFLKNELKKKLYLNNSGDFKEMEKKIKNKIIKKKKEGS